MSAANKKGAGPAGSLKLRRTARGINLRATGQLAQQMLTALQSSLQQPQAGRYTTVRFVDEGQDALEWDLDADRLVIACRPYQQAVWKGTRVIGAVVPGERLAIVTPRSPEGTYFKHAVAEVVEGVRK